MWRAYNVVLYIFSRRVPTPFLHDFGKCGDCYLASSFIDPV